MSYDYDFRDNDPNGKFLCFRYLLSSTDTNMNGLVNIIIKDTSDSITTLNLTQMISFAIEPLSFSDVDNKLDFNITTKFKNDTACKGIAFTQTCKLHQGLVEYSVILKNSSISLRHFHWQNDSYLQDFSSDLRTDAALWDQAFMNLYRPVRFNQSQLYCNGSVKWSGLLTNCPRWNREVLKTNMICVYQTVDTPMTFRESIDFAIENVGKSCERTWRNPMQVMWFFVFVFVFVFLDMIHTEKISA